MDEIQTSVPEVEPLIEPFIIEYEGRKFSYFFNDTCAEQAETARMISEFAYDQADKGTDDIQKVLLSKGDQWKLLVIGYLLREVKNGTLQSFDKYKSEKEIIPIVKKMPASFINKEWKVIIEDFFINIGLNSMKSLLSPKTNAIKDLIPFLQLMSMIQTNTEPNKSKLSNDSTTENIASIPTNSLDV